MPDRTYRRADGELIYGEYSTVDSPEFFDDTDEPTEVVEEEWALMRSRTRILGPKGLCVACQGEGVLPTWSPTTLTLGPETTCGVCDGSGEEPERDLDPPWTDTLHTQALRIGRAALACEVVGVCVQMEQGTEFIRQATDLLTSLLAAGDDE